MELLHGMEEVHEEGDQAHPEGRHGHKDEPLPHGLLSVVRGRAHNTDESYQVGHLQQTHIMSVKYDIRERICFLPRQDT